jgi:raffinose/stachyose/melibiose transport system permease protein
MPASAKAKSAYPLWFFLPAAIIYGVLFIFPTIASLFFSLTRWTLFDRVHRTDNFVQFFKEPFLIKGLINTLVYGVLTSGLKVVLGMMLALLLTSDIIGRGYLRAVVFFPVIVSTIGVGITFTVLAHPTQGVINETIALFGLKGPGWFSDPISPSIRRSRRRGRRGLATVLWPASFHPQDY